MKKVNLILQGKGGVGKSMVASFLCQYHMENENPLLAIDTDPINTTLKKFKEIKAVYVDILEDNKINERRFDELIEHIAQADEDTNIIIDNGASSFVPLKAYLIENHVNELLSEMGMEIIYHTIITGGQAMNDTLEGFAQLSDITSNIYIWKNEYYGKIEHNNKTFEQSKIYTENKDKVQAIINIAKKNQNTFQADLEEMLSHHLTFNEAINTTSTKLMSRQRLKTLKNEIFEQLKASGL